MADIKGEAAKRVAAAELPTFEAEEWRYSPIDDLKLSAYTPVVDAPTADAVDPVISVAEVAGQVVTVDGHIQELHLDPALAERGIVLSRASDLAEAVSFGDATDVFADANLAYGPDAVVLTIPAGRDVELPIVIHHQLSTDGGSTYPRLLVDVGADASVTIVETLSSPDIEALVSPVTEIMVGPSARVRYQHLQALGPRVWQLGSLVTDVGQQANFVGGLSAMGGHYARLRTDCRLTGRGANGDLLAVYYGDGEQTLDFRTFQDHLAPDTSSRLLFKGVIDDTSKSVYTGLIRVAPDAAGTNAFQTNRNIKLSDDAWAESVPNLEIENNDVRCSHASTVGPVDAEQRFYLESRGVPTAVVERLIVAGFFDEVLRELPVAEVTSRLRSDVQEKLDGRDA